jgi:hypothetical protein
MKTHCTLKKYPWGLPPPPTSLLLMEVTTRRRGVGGGWASPIIRKNRESDETHGLLTVRHDGGITLIQGERWLVLDRGNGLIALLSVVHNDVVRGIETLHVDWLQEACLPEIDELAYFADTFIKLSLYVTPLCLYLNVVDLLFALEYSTREESGAHRLLILQCDGNVLFFA